MNTGRRGGLVYSTDGGRACPACRKPVAACTCKAAPSPRGDGNVRVARAVQGRGGKVVTVIRGLPLEATPLVKTGRIELQGEHRDRVVALLHEKGWQAKRAGG